MELDGHFIGDHAGVFPFAFADVEGQALDRQGAVEYLLAAVGLYGVLAYTVAQRTREFGVRMALGAEPARVRGMVLKQVALMTVVGGVLGLAAAIGLGRLAQSLLFEIKGYDPIVLAASAVLLALVAFAAGFIPAHRASKVDPMRALRYE